MSILSGIHPIAEALRANHPLDRVLVAQGAQFNNGLGIKPEE